MFATNNFNLSKTSQSVVVFLGAPMSGGQHLNTIQHGKKEELLLLTKILELMPSHDSLFQLRNVLAAPRLMYLLRTSLCTDSPELLLYDSVLRNSHWWLQASLPVAASQVGRTWHCFAGTVCLFDFSRKHHGTYVHPSASNDCAISRSAVSRPQCLPVQCLKNGGN